jgi:phage shock protein PspC (stress-responsive transcriptional regulator)
MQNGPGRLVVAGHGLLPYGCFEFMTMYRSFTERVLGGVCGGLAADFRVNPWILRLIFVIFIVASRGVGLTLYLALWWAMPQESLIQSRRGNLGRFLLILVVVVGIVAAWVGDLNGMFHGSDGQAILWPVVLVILGSVFLLRQVFR